MNNPFLRAAAMAAMLALAACQPSQPAADAEPPLAGARIGGPFTLTDQDGRQVTDRSFAGRYRIMYFGYTFCPDVCPVDLQKIGAGLKALEATDSSIAQKIVPVFVTVDPRRDTTPVLKEFVANFHPRLVGLGGSQAAIDAAAKQYGVYYQLHEPGPGGGYLVDHSRQAVLFGPDGKPIALVPAEKTPDEIAAELKRWVA